MGCRSFRSALPLHTWYGYDNNLDGVSNDIFPTAFKYTGISSAGVPSFKEIGSCDTVNCSRGASLSQLNLRVSKTVHVYQHVNAELIADFFNLTNAINPAFNIGAAAAVRDLPVSATFVGWPTYNHPLLLLGRKMTLGYIGHTQSHGLDWQPTYAKVKDILGGEPGWRQRCEELRVRYLFWGADEMENASSSTQPWRESARRVAHGSWGELYDLEQPAVALTVPPLRVSGSAAVAVIRVASGK